MLVVMNTQLIIKLCNKGLTPQQISRTTGDPDWRVRRILHRAGKSWDKKHILIPREKILELFRDGRTQREIALMSGVSHQAISHITRSLGVSRFDGGMSARAARRKERELADKNAWAVRIYGISRDERLSIIRSHGSRVFRAFCTQRTNARKRGIPFLLTFPQWWGLWLASGHWHERGVGQGYVMARFKDQGAYEIGNVRIVTAVENMLEYHKLRRELLAASSA